MKALRYTLCGAVLATGLLHATPSPQRAADNTAVNKAGGDSRSVTAGQSKNDKNDRDLTRNIRRDVVKDKGLSTYGHNVKVIAQNGRVTLRGPVRSDDERKTIESYARKHAGESNVDNQLTVKNDSERK